MITTNPALDQAMRALAMAVTEHRSKTGLDYDPAIFELRVNDETWRAWQMSANDIHPVLSQAIFERQEFMGFKIVRDNDTTPGRLILRCIWEMAIL